MKPPMGVLGMRLGTFAVIEGTEHQTSKFWGAEDLVVEKVNGQTPPREVGLQTDWPSLLNDKRIPGKRYVLHGYESGQWEGQPDGLPNGETSGRTQGGRFVFTRTFVVTSVEKVDGVTVADARPVDPEVPLAVPDFAAKPDNVRPIGVLGLPLGTFAIIEARSSAGIVLLASPYDVLAVNGQPVDQPRILTIRDVPAARGIGRLKLHGYEVGAWKSDPDLPKSENPSGGRSQQPFQFYHSFMVTSPYEVVR